METKNEILIREKILSSLTVRVNNCRKCGITYGNSSVGFGSIHRPAVFFVGMNPWVENHKFKDGKGITILRKWFKDRNFTDFYFDNVVKCEMPGEFKPDSFHVKNCVSYLLIQILNFKPYSILTFGEFARDVIDDSKLIGVNGEPIPTFSFQHFSFPLRQGEKALKKYYFYLQDTMIQIWALKYKGLTENPFTDDDIPF